MVSLLECVPELAREAEAIAKAHLVMPTRPQTVSYRLLLRHAEYIVGVAQVMLELAQGNEEKAQETASEFARSFGRYEFEIERYFDHLLAFRCIQRRISGNGKDPQEGM